MKKLFTLSVCLAFALTSMAGTVFKKVLTPQDDYSGEYIILHENDSLNQAIIFNGALITLDVKNNNFVAPIFRGSDDVRYVEGTDEVMKATFTITKNGDVYYIPSTSGYYIGYNSTVTPIEPNLKSNAEKPYDNTIAMSATGTSIVITSKNGFELRYNSDETAQRFRYHASGKKKGIKLYKKTEVTDGIEDLMATQKASNATYDINGRRVVTTQKGMLYLRNGKTFIAR